MSDIISKEYLASNPSVKEKIKQAIQKVADIVGTTYGPNGENVIIAQRANGVDNVIVTKDGVTVLSTLAFEDPVERAISKLMVDAGQRVLREEGDGTTTVTLATAELYSHIANCLSDAETDRYIFKKEIFEQLDKICDRIDSFSRPITKAEQLVQVATISANGDKSIGQEVGRLSFELGKNGVIVTEPSRTVGIKGERKNGYVAGITNKEQIINSAFLLNKAKIEIDNAYVLLIDDTMQNIDDMQDFFNFCKTGNSLQGKDLVLICRGVLGTFLQTLSNDYQRGGRIIAVKMPHDMMAVDWKDLSKVLAAPMIFSNVTIPIVKFSDYAKREKTANWQNLVGKAKKITIYKDKFVVEPQSQELIDKTIGELEKLRNENTSETEYNDISARISKLSGGIGVVQVGATTDSEQSRILAAIDDAQRACFSAWRGGVVLGGVATMLAACRLQSIPYAVEIPKQKMVSSNMFNQAAIILFYKLYKTAYIGLIEGELANSENPILIDVNTGKVIEDGWSAGIIEPANVLKRCLRVATTQAWEIANSGAIIDLTLK